MPTLREFLEKNKDAKDANLEQKIVFFGLNHEFDKDPRKYCPECESSRIVNTTPRHSIDYNAYRCQRCSFYYGLDYEPVGHGR